MPEAVILIGLGSAALAGVTGFQAFRAALELTAMQPGTGAALKRIYDQVLEEPVPEDMTRLLASMDEEASEANR